MQGLCLCPDRQEGQSESQRENLSDEPVCEVIWVECLCVGVSGPDFTFIAGTRDAPTHTKLMVIFMLRLIVAIYNILQFIIFCLILSL